MAKRTGHWLETATHKKFYILNPRASDICIEDIAIHLSHETRFGGAVQKPYSVAEHCIHICRLATSRGAKFAGLMHDAHEAYTKDIPSPVKRAISEIAGFDLYKELTDPIDRAIERAFNFRLQTHKEQIKMWDVSILQAEAREIAGTTMLEEWTLPEIPSSYEITDAIFKSMRQPFVNQYSYKLDPAAYQEYCRDTFIELFEKYRPR